MPITFSSHSLKTTPQANKCLRVLTDWPHPKDSDHSALFMSQEGALLRTWIKQTGMSAFEECMEFVSLFERAGDEKTISSWLVDKSHSDAEVLDGQIEPSKYLTSDMSVEAHRTLAACAAKPANMTLVLGKTASQLVSGNKQFKLDKNRGSVAWSPVLKGKWLCTYHPRHVRTKWKDYTLALMDTLKAFSQSESPDFNPPAGKVYIAQTLEDVKEITEILLDKELFSVDIETMPIDGDTQIDCIGFAPDNTSAYVIPVFDRFRIGGKEIDLRTGRTKAYAGEWSLPEELVVWQEITKIMGCPALKIMQNGTYDSWNLWETYGIPTIGGFDDTMLMQHALHVELPKGLDLLGSLYTNRTSWKDMRQFNHKGE